MRSNDMLSITAAHAAAVAFNELRRAVAVCGLVSMDICAPVMECGAMPCVRAALSRVIGCAENRVLCRRRPTHLHLTVICISQPPYLINCCRIPFFVVEYAIFTYCDQHIRKANAKLLAIVVPSGCTMASGVFGGGVCNRSQIRTSKCTCLIFGVSIGFDPG